MATDLYNLLVSDTKTNKVLKEEIVGNRRITLFQNLRETPRAWEYKYTLLVSNAKSGAKAGDYLGFNDLEKAEKRYEEEVESHKRYAQQKLDTKQAYKDEAQALLDKTNVGDIWAGSWGYDATFWDFYQVVGKKGSTLQFKELVKSRNYEDLSYGPASLGKVMPVKNKFASDEVITKRITNGYGAKMSSYKYIHPWDGKPKEEDDYN